MLKEYVLLIILLAALFHDIKSRRIPNYLNFAAMLIALLINLYTLGWIGLINAFYGILTGFVLLIVPYIMGGLGAGDVKLLMAVGAFVGAAATVNVFLNGAIVGGVYSFLIMAKQRELVPFFKKIYYAFFFSVGKATRGKNLEVFNKEHEKTAIPYAVAIASGVVLSIWVRWV